MKRLIMLFAAIATMGFLRAEEGAALTDGEIWNEGVDYYRAGDVTNALRVLRPLMLSRTHGARAAEVVACIAHERGEREEAAAAAQIALRAAPDDAKANRNFTRAVNGLADYRREKHVEAVLKAAQGKDPGTMLGGAVREARSLMDAAGGLSTNRAERAVQLADILSMRANALADVWLPVRELIAQSVTNEEQAATILAQLDQAEAKTKAAAKALGDLDQSAYGNLSDAEHDFNRFHKLAALPPAAIDEDLVAQSNAWLDVEKVNGRDWQPEALDWTRAFRAKFPSWARAYEQQAQSDTNKPPFTAEDQAKVSALATELEKIQLECCEKQLPASQEKAIGIINQIRELLPKDKNGGGGGQQQNPQQNNQQNDKDRQPDQQDQQNQDSEQPDQPQDKQDPDEQQDQEKDEAAAEEQKDEEKSADEKEIEALLKKAQERNDEHEEEKKARMRKSPLPPNERDW